ncbi:MAG: hypothetical protein IKU43_10580 [Clostridia bacterium]|nr:hypothetical protein [Clostridia bacterium]
MKIKKILLSLFAGAMLAGSMAFVAFAQEAADVAMLAGTDIYFDTLNDAFTLEGNPEGKSIILLGDCTQDVEVTSGKSYTFYLKGYTLTGTFKTTNGTVHINGSAEMDGGAYGTITDTGVDGAYPVYNNQTSGGNNLDITACNVIATEADGIAIYGVGEKTNVKSANVTGDVKAENGGLINIDAGTYNGNIIEGKRGTINISGGTFSANPSAFLPFGYAAVLEGDVYTVKAESNVTVDEAFAKDEDGAYLLNTANDVALFRLLINYQNPKVAFSGKTFKLTADIDFGGAELPVVCDDNHRFGGIFDGQGHTISDFEIDGTGTSNVGFFGLTYGATIKDVTFKDVTVTGDSNYTAVVVGFARTSATTTLDNVNVIGETNVTGSGKTAGLVGGGQLNVTNCKVDFNGTISGSIDVAGLVGLVSAGSSEIIGNTVSNVNIKSSNGIVGGVAGRVISSVLAFEDNELSNVDIEVADDADYTDSYGLIFGALQINDNGEFTVSDNTATASTMTVAGETKTELYNFANYNGNKNETGVVINVAKIGDEYFTTLPEAIAAAQPGDTVTVIYDIEYTVNPAADAVSAKSAFICIEKNDIITLDLNGKVISVKGADDAKYDTLAILNYGDLIITDTSAKKNGKIVFAFDGTQESGSSQIHSTILNFGTLTLNAGTLENKSTKGYGRYTVNNYSWGGNSIFTMNGGTVINDTTIAVYADTYSDYNRYTNDVVVNGGVIEGGLYFYGRECNPDVSLTVNGGEFYGVNYGGLTVRNTNNSNVTVAVTGGTFKSENSNGLTVVGTFNPFVSGGAFDSDVSEYTTSAFACVAEHDGMYVIVDEKYVVEAIKVEFVNVTEETAEGEMVYNINLVATDDDIINRLNSADLTFKLTSVHDMAYEIIASNDEVAINPVNNSADRYEFHYKNKDDNVDTDTANTITIGQVKFVGYGKYGFEIVGDTNAVHTTKLYDNIVDTFVPNDEDGVQNGELIISNEIEDAYIAVPTRNLIINVDFPNSVNDNVIAYQDMTVTVAGGDLAEAIVIKLGSDAVATDIDTENDKADAKYFAEFVDGAYVITVTDVLTVNTSYNVTVEGAGYRTARYTVTMNCKEKKTLNFWNNVKDNAIEVEVGKDSSAKKVTFLAGDIVKDSLINIYDLSAVVSYFGENMDTAKYNDYAKYDLNRDGKIDSKDVAYVLVSWGK